mmetsp:Transcript_4269/g.13696  ORF Transcript_4269/g.13696 Transcript_4269/m.13696 type:complete len:264 (+) Transcript_4269:95-886(+)
MVACCSGWEPSTGTRRPGAAPPAASAAAATSAPVTRRFTSPSRGTWSAGRGCGRSTCASGRSCRRRTADPTSTTTSHTLGPSHSRADSSSAWASPQRPRRHRRPPPPPGLRRACGSGCCGACRRAGPGRLWPRRGRAGRASIASASSTRRAPRSSTSPHWPAPAGTATRAPRSRRASRARPRIRRWRPRPQRAPQLQLGHRRPCLQRRPPRPPAHRRRSPALRATYARAWPPIAPNTGITRGPGRPTGRGRGWCARTSASTGT